MPLPPRPLLKPALRQIWRDGGTLQLGLEPRHAIVLHGLNPQDATTLTLLDGNRDLRAIVTDAAAAGCDPVRVTSLLDLLRQVDALDDAPAADPRLEPDLLSLSLLHAGAGAAGAALARRRASTVVVHGAGRVGAAVAALLAAAGVGRLRVDDPAPVRAADLSPAGIRDQGAGDRATAATQPLRRRTGTTVTTGSAGPLPDLAVVAPAASHPAPEVLAVVRRVPHLYVGVRETTAVVGPLVIPGVTPCLRCLHLARADRDPQWGAMTAQLVGRSRDVEPCDVTLATMAAALGAMQALAFLAEPTAKPPTVGAVLELDLADARLRRRSLQSHADCGCGSGTGGATIGG